MKKLSFIMLLIIFSCKGNEHKEIIGFINDIKISMNQGDIEKFKNSSLDPYENNFLFMHHYNEGFLESKEGEPVKSYFKKIGITDNNNITNILFMGLHRSLNNEKLELEALIQSTIDIQARRLNLNKNP